MNQSDEVNETTENPKAELEHLSEMVEAQFKLDWAEVKKAIPTDKRVWARKYFKMGFYASANIFMGNAGGDNGQVVEQ